MQKRTFRLSMLLASALLFAALLAACGGGSSSSSVSSDDVAVVGGTQITKQQYAQLLAQAKLSFKQNGRAFPKQGTTEYEAVKAQVMNLLVQEQEREHEAKTLGIVVTDKQITNRLNADQEAVLRRQPEEVPGRAQEAGSPRSRCGTRSGSS